MIVDTHAAHRAGSSSGNSDFFNQRAMEHIARCFELMRALELPFNLRTAYNLLANKDHLKNTLDTVPEYPRAKELLPLVQHFEMFYLNLKSEGQSEGELGTIGNFLAPYQHPAVAEVFCSDEPDTVTIDQVDQGKKICLSMSEEYAHERKYVFSVLKLLFYQHGLRRLDLKARDPHEFWKKNLLVLVGEEFQDVVTSSVGGISDCTVSGTIREANVALIAVTQSYLSLLPPHASKDQANVLVLNLRNRMIFRAADEQCAKQSAEFSESLIRLARKLQEQNKSKTQLNREQAEDLHALHTKLTDLRSHIDVVKRELLGHRYDHAYATPQKPAQEGLRGGVVDRTITSEQAAQKVRDLDAQLEKEYGDLLTNSASAHHLFEPSDPARARLHELIQQDRRYRTLDEYLSKQRTDSTIRLVTSRVSQ